MKIILKPKKVKKIVLYCDICCSTSILEVLLRSENTERWVKLLAFAKEYLRDEREIQGFEIYKFIGDGWILLFDEDMSGYELLLWLREFCKKYRSLFKKMIEPYLESNIDKIGMSFGADIGTLICTQMLGKKEYIGRALNVAGRLQTAIKDKDSNPQNKILMTKNLYTSIGTDEADEFPVSDVTRSLRNISDGKNFQCKKITLLK
jgi:class 3 adenylate cyclase